MSGGPERTRARRLGSLLTAWFGGAARNLPWRVTGKDGRRDPYRVLVSEVMLQQTQASRVAERFDLFMAKFPSIAALARAEEGEVLDAWAGLGYYRRARMLLGAARACVEHFGGEMPGDVGSLVTLPGVGRYTAGAVASLAFGGAEPLVDGNVTRVLLRLEGRDGRLGEGATVRWAWSRAGELVAANAERAGGVNEALMELGATVCVPGVPRCGACPLRGDCVAVACGLQARVPAPAVRAQRIGVEIRCAAVFDAGGRVLLERAGKGELWAGLWRLPSVLVKSRAEGGRTSRGLAAGLGVGGVVLRPAGQVQRVLTHRVVTLRAWRGVSSDVEVDAKVGRTWRKPELALGEMSSAYGAVLRMVMGGGKKTPRGGEASGR